MMNYIKEMNAFYDHMEYNPLSSSSVALWFALMHVNNKTRWKNEFTVAGNVLRVKAGLKETSFKRARAELKEKGYIDYESRGAGLAPIYRMVGLAKVWDEDAGKDTVLVDDQHVEKTVGAVIEQNQLKEKETADAVLFYQQNIGVVSPFVAASLMDWINDMGEDLVIEAMKRALEQNKTSWGYVKSILQAWLKKGIRTIAQVRAEEVEFRNKLERSKEKKQKYRNTMKNGVSKEVVPEWFREKKEKEKSEKGKKKLKPEKVEAQRLEIERLKGEFGAK